MIEAALQFVLRVGEVLQQLGVVIEMDEEGLIAFGPEHLFDEPPAGVPLFAQNFALAEAGIDQQAKREREIRLAGKITNDLWTPLLGKIEIILRQIGNDFALFIADGRQHVDDFDVYGNFRIRLLA